MKSNKQSLLNKTQTSGRFIQQIDDEEIYIDQRMNSTIPYSQLKEELNENIQSNKNKIPTILQSYQPQQSSQLSNNIHSQFNKPQVQTSNINSSFVHPQFHVARVSNYQLPVDAPVYHISQLKNSVIRVGSSGIQIQKRAPFVPPIVVQCSHCKCKQNIPGDADKYFCCQCKKLSDIEPKFGLFICGVCHHHVSYPFNTSELIQCNICYTVNKVPICRPQIQQKKEIVKMTKRPLEETQMLLPKQLREQGFTENIEQDQATTIRSEIEQSRLGRHKQDE